MAKNYPLDFVHTGPGALAGRYLRMFWQPIYRVKDLASGRAVPIKIMSEDFTLYRGENGTPHLTAFRCAHRGTQLSTGWVEGDSIRCRYHGWKYDGTGQCVEQPGEEEGFASKVKIRSYPVKEYLGLIFAYLGEGEPPPLRRFADFERPGINDNGPVEYWPCNYFNRLDNACDAGHVVFTHQDSIVRAGRPDQLAPRRLNAEETAYGVRTAILVEGKPPVYLHFHMPNINQVRIQVQIEGTREDAANLWADRLFWRVPVDDQHSVSYASDWIPLTGKAAEDYQKRRQEARAAFSAVAASHNELATDVLAGKMGIKDIDLSVNMYELFLVEDYAVQVGQGPIAPRAQERLGRLDAGLVILRLLWERELMALEQGRPLKQWKTPAGLADESVVVEKIVSSQPDSEGRFSEQETGR